MTLKPALKRSVFVIAAAALAATLFAAGVRPMVIEHCAYGSVSYQGGQLTAEGKEFTVVRDGVGRYTITYKHRFRAPPRVVVDPVQTSIARNPDGTFDSIAGGGTDAFQVRCAVASQSATQLSLDCAGIDPRSQVCTSYVDDFGNIITICIYTRLAYGDIPFHFAAFGDGGVWPA